MICNHLRIKALFVRAKGIEPIRLSAPDPKSGLSTNFNTPAIWDCKCTTIYRISKFSTKKHARLSETESHPYTETQGYVVMTCSEVVPQLESMVIACICRISIRISGTYPQVCQEPSIYILVSECA